MSHVQERTNKKSFEDTYRYVMDQKKKIDDHLYRLQEQLLSMVKDGRGKPLSGHKFYVPRVENKRILLESIFAVMVPGREMTMNEVMRKLKNRHVYKTNSKYFYTMVNNKLNRQDLKVVGPIRRGVFVYQPSSKQLILMEKYKESARNHPAKKQIA